VNTLNVLITAGSRRVPLVQHFRRVLRSHDVRGSVIVTDVNLLSPAVHMADRACLVPLSADPSYIDAIAALCEENSVGLVVPTIDDELEIFAAARNRFDARGIQVAVSSETTTAICNDKLLTCDHLRANGIAAAQSWLRNDVPVGAALPLFVKPRYGRGSVRAFAANSRRELEFFSDYVPDAVVQEYLEGPEFTIDLLCDFNGRPLSIVPRERVVIRSGVTDRGRTVADPRLIDLALACARVFDFVGPINIQCRIVQDRPVVFEINPRFSGGIPLTIAAGAHFPRMLVDLALGRTVAPRIGDFIDGLWMTSYESSVFLTNEQATASDVLPGSSDVLPGFSLADGDASLKAGSTLMEKAGSTSIGEVA